MNYCKINGVNKSISQLVYGCAIGIMSGGGNNHAVLDATLDAGITVFDTARNYGDSEVSLGNWIHDRQNRENVVVLSKCCHPEVETPQIDRVNAQAIRTDLEISLQKLKTDYIDIYLLHRDQPETSVEEVIDTLDDLKKQGKILSYGVSNWTKDRFCAANEYAKAVGKTSLQVNSPNYSLAEQVNDPWQTGSEAITLCGTENEPNRIWYQQNQIPIFAYSSLGRGLFSGKFTADSASEASKGMDIYAMRGFFSENNIERLRRCEILATQKGKKVPQIALAWLMNQDLQVHPIISYSTTAHLADNIHACDILLTKEELDWLNLQIDTLSSL